MRRRASLPLTSPTSFRAASCAAITVSKPAARCSSCSHAGSGTSHAMDKHAVAIVLEEIGTLLEIHGDNKFKARAFVGAARSIEKLPQDLDELTRRGELETIPGVGPATAGVIRELVTTGTSRYYLELRDRTPDGLLELLAVPRLGATRIRTLHEKLGV